MVIRKRCMFRSRRAQLTLFFLIITVMIGMFWFVSYINKSVTEKQLGREADRVVSNLLKSDAVSYYTTLCLDTAAKDSIRLAGLQGGNIYTNQGGPSTPTRFLPVFSELFNQSMKVGYGISKPALVNGTDYPKIPGYPGRGQSPSLDFTTWGRFGFVSLRGLCDSEGENRAWEDPTDNKIRTLADIVVPFCLSSMYESSMSTQEQLEFAIKKRMISCVNWTDIMSYTAYDITPGDPNIRVRYGESDVFVDAFYPVDVMVGGVEPITRMADFHSKVKVRLKKIGELATVLAQQDSYELLFNLSSEYKRNSAWDSNMNISISTPYKALGRYDDLITIKDERSYIDGKPFKYQFVRENRWPTLDYIHYLSSWGEKFDIVVIENDTITIDPDPDSKKIYDPDEDKLFYNYTGWKETCDEPFNFDRGVVEYACSQTQPTFLNDVSAAPISRSPKNWTTSEDFKNSNRTASYVTNRLDIGPHNVTVWVCDDGGLCDYQVVKIMVFDIPVLHLNTSNPYDDIPPERASIEDSYELDTSGTTSYFTVFENFIWTDILEPALGGTDEPIVPFLATPAEQKIVTLPSDPLFDIENIQEKTFEKNVFDNNRDLWVTDETELLTEGLTNCCDNPDFIDFDHDLLDDRWEFKFAEDGTCSDDPDATLCTAGITELDSPDIDGDGFSNRAECFACTNPRDSSDVPENPVKEVPRGPFIVHNISMDVLPSSSNTPLINQVEVYQCLPHRSEYPSYPYQNYYVSEDNIDDTLLDPFQANHTCCSDGSDGSWGSYEGQDTVCFEPDPVYGSLWSMRSFDDMNLIWHLPINPADFEPTDSFSDIGDRNLDKRVLMTNDILNKTTKVHCSGERGNICNGPVSMDLNSEKECADYEVAPDESRDYVIERCEGPQASSPASLTVEATSPNRFSCQKYSPGMTFEKAMNQQMNEPFKTALSKNRMNGPPTGTCSQVPRCGTETQYDVDVEGEEWLANGAECGDGSNNPAGYCSKPKDPVNCIEQSTCSVKSEDIDDGLYTFNKVLCKELVSDSEVDALGVGSAKCQGVPVTDLDTDSYACTHCFEKQNGKQELFTNTLDYVETRSENLQCCGDDLGEGGFSYSELSSLVDLHGDGGRSSEGTDAQCSDYFKKDNNLYVIDNDCDGKAACEEPQCKNHQSPHGGICCDYENPGNSCSALPGSVCEYTNKMTEHQNDKISYYGGSPDDYKGAECDCKAGGDLDHPVETFNMPAAMGCRMVGGQEVCPTIPKFTFKTCSPSFSEFARSKAPPLTRIIKINGIEANRPYSFSVDFDCGHGELGVYGSDQVEKGIVASGDTLVTGIKTPGNFFIIDISPNHPSDCIAEITIIGPNDV